MAGLTCYACNRSFDLRQHAEEVNEDGSRLCPGCGSDFVELVDVPPPQQQQQRAATQTSNAFSIADLTSMLGAAAAPPGAGPTPGGGLLFPQPAAGLPQQHHVFTSNQNGQRVELHLTSTSVPVPDDLFHSLFPGGRRTMPMISMVDNTGRSVLFGGLDLPGGFNPGDFASGDSLDALLTQLMHAHQPRAQPTPQSVIDALPRLKVKERAEAGSEPSASGDDKDAQHAACAAGEPCTVCHDAFKHNDEVLQLQCKHCFHPDCILPWLKDHNTCPVCRASVASGLGTDSQQQHSSQRAHRSSAGAAHQRAPQPQQQAQQPVLTPQDIMSTLRQEAAALRQVLRGGRPGQSQQQQQGSSGSTRTSQPADASASSDSWGSALTAGFLRPRRAPPSSSSSNSSSAQRRQQNDERPAARGQQQQPGGSNGQGDDPNDVLRQAIGDVVNELAMRMRSRAAAGTASAPNSAANAAASGSGDSSTAAPSGSSGSAARHQQPQQRSAPVFVAHGGQQQQQQQEQEGGAGASGSRASSDRLFFSDLHGHAPAARVQRTASSQDAAALANTPTHAARQGQQQQQGSDAGAASGSAAAAGGAGSSSAPRAHHAKSHATARTATPAHSSRRSTTSAPAARPSSASQPAVATSTTAAATSNRSCMDGTSRTAAPSFNPITAMFRVATAPVRWLLMGVGMVLNIGLHRG